MRFHDSETQKMLRDTARGYFRDKYPWERLYALESGDAQMTGADLQDFAGLGWLALVAPEAAGGGGASLLEAAVVIDESGYAAVPAPIAVSNVAAYAMSLARNDAGDHIRQLAAGRRLYTISDSARRHSANGRTLVASNGRVTGSVALVPFGAAADFLLAPLSIDGEPALVILPLEGARRESVQLLDRPTDAHIHCDGLPLDACTVLATGADAERLQERCDALTTALSTIQLAGMLTRVMEMTGEYISNRVQFGQPIAKFQAARHHAADLLMHAETTRWPAYHALWRFEQDWSDTAEIWLARHWAIRASQKTFEITHLLHGGIGVGLEYPLHLYTQGMVGLASRSGTMDEMVARTGQSLSLSASAGTPAAAQTGVQTGAKTGRRLPA